MPAASLLSRGVVRHHGATVVLDGVDLVVGPRSRIGVVGPNGVGKSTLLRVLAGIETPDGGSVELAPPTATVGYLPQEPERRPAETLRAFLARRTGVTAAQLALDGATVALDGGDEGAPLRYTEALDRWLALGGADLDARSGAVCADVGLGGAALDREMTTFSGGEAARASLAGILLSRFDVFLLDEPTNDLDFAGLDRLERFVAELQGGVVIVSHDRDFLDRTITSVLELDEASRRGTEYAGGWSTYVDLRATARRHAEEAFEGYAGERRRLEDRARVQKQWAETGVRRIKKSSENDKHIKRRESQRSEKQASKVRITEKALTRLDRVEKPWEGWELHLDLAGGQRSGDVVARLAGAVVERGDFRLGPLDLEIGWGERVAILGPNGAGKTTLLRAILGQLPLTGGTRWLGPGVVVGELEQSRARFSGGRLLDAFVRESGMLPQEGRSLLAKFGLAAGHVDRTGDSLSPGERTRAGLALLMASGTNCLVLDEPTNHLDVPAIEQLESALERFTGTVLLVTHDRKLLEAVRLTRTIEVGSARGSLSS